MGTRGCHARAARSVRSGATTGRIPAIDRQPIGRLNVAEPANSCGARDETPANIDESADADADVALKLSAPNLVRTG